MAITHDYEYVDPTTIKIDRENRQRREINTSGLIDSIRLRGVLQPIIVDRDYNLIAGERRLTCCLKLGINVPIRFFDTLEPGDSAIIELEENVKRADLTWQDEVMAIGRIHDYYSSIDPTWTQTRTAEVVCVTEGPISEALTLYREMNNPAIADASGRRAAYNILLRAQNRAGTAVLTDILEGAANVFKPSAPVKAPTPTLVAPDGEQVTLPEPEEEAPPADPESILNVSFTDWVTTYTGPKFNFIHCDFPYGINVFAGKQMRANQSNFYKDDPDIYWELLGSLLENFDKVASSSCHVVFWFSMKYYTETMQLLSTKLTVNPHPFIWLKSDNSGIIPDPLRSPRQIYETAFLCYRGDRQIVKSVSNAYASPSPKKIHPSEKSEVVLNYLFSMYVDNTTKMLDPTCGSGTALRAAENFGAEHVLGLELDPEHHQNAVDALRHSRVLRRISK